MSKISESLGIRISERMVGNISWCVPPSLPSQLNSQFEINEKYPFDFSIHAFSKFPLKYPIPFQFKGSCNLPGLPVAQGSPQTVKHPDTLGDMTLSARGVTYDFTTSLPGYGLIRIRGSKKYTHNPLFWKTFRRGLTYLLGDVERDGKIIGKIEMFYPLPLWRFPLGVTVCSSEFAYRPNLKLARKLFHWIPRLYPDHSQVGTEDEITQSLETQLNHTQPFIRPVIRFSNFWLRLFHPRLEKNSRSPIFVPVIATALTALFSSKDYLKKKGQNIVQIPTQFENEKWMSLVHGPGAALGHEEIECDVVVLGSGAGGAALASSLSKKGFAVSIVEEGDFFKRQDLTGLSSEMARKLYRKQGMDLFISNSPIWIPTGKCVGGTTFINSGTCVKPSIDLMEKWKGESQDPNFDLARYLPEVESHLGIIPVPQKYQGGIARVLEKGLTGTPCRFGPLDRAESGCDGQAACVIGCPTEAKRSTAVSFIPDALKNQAHLFTPFRAEKIIFKDGRAVGLKCQVEGFGQEFNVTFKAKAVIIAAGTFGTPTLMYRSGITPSMLPALGKNLSIHPALTIGALFKENVRETHFVPQSMGIFDMGHSDYICEGYTLPVDVISTAMFQWGSELKQIMDRIGHFTNFSSMIKDVTFGKIHFSPWGSIPSYFIEKKTRAVLKHSAIFISKMFLKAGAEKVFVPIYGHRVLKNSKDLDSLSKSTPRFSDFSLSAHHPLGTCRMGTDPSKSVVDWNGKVHGFEGLYVCDGSAIPGPLGVNPQVTIMANALRIADHIAGKLS